MPAKGWKNIIVPENLHEKLSKVKGKSFHKKIETLLHEHDKFRDLKQKYDDLLNRFNGGNPLNDNASPLQDNLECPYATWRDPNHIDCAKDFKKNGKVYMVTKAFHERCWEREQKEKIKVTLRLPKQVTELYKGVFQEDGETLANVLTESLIENAQGLIEGEAYQCPRKFGEPECKKCTLQKECRTARERIALRSVEGLHDES